MKIFLAAGRSGEVADVSNRLPECAFLLVHACLPRGPDE